MNNYKTTEIHWLLKKFSQLLYITNKIMIKVMNSIYYPIFTLILENQILIINSLFLFPFRQMIDINTNKFTIIINIQGKYRLQHKTMIINLFLYNYCMVRS